jgi:23S rRNA pseudouridine955/2504/2580 synthase
LNGLRPKAEVRSAASSDIAAPAASASLVTVDENHDGQRLDNFLIRLCRGVPKSHVYRLIRSGQVRVNGGRADADRRLLSGDRVRIPPIRMSAPPADGEPDPADARRSGVGAAWGLAPPIIHEDDDLLVLDKPAGMAVHGGSGISLSVIEALRRNRPEARFLELVHRLDRETSGALLVARRRPALLSLQQQFRDRHTVKIYLAVVVGRWPFRTRVLRHPLRRLAAPDGDRRVVVDDEGREAQTRVTGLARFELEGLGEVSLVMARLDTGRTHQIRVHLAQEGTPIVGDDKYGDFGLNRQFAKRGLRRMFLHAWRLEVSHPNGSGRMRVQVDPAADFQAIGLAGSPPMKWSSLADMADRGAGGESR